MPYFAFKCNTTAAFGGAMAKMFHLFSLNQDEYLSHYHKRPNVESTFSMVKANFGDSLRSRTDVALTNEVLAKVFCDNLVRLVQAIFELGFTPMFFDDEDTDQSDQDLHSTALPPAPEDDPTAVWTWVCAATRVS
jgi:hypothetical protein